MQLDLVDSDASSLDLLGLGDDDSQDAVVKRGADSLGVNTAGEGEGSRELAEAALRHPELVLGGRGRGVLGGRLLDGLVAALRLVAGVVLDGDLVGLLLGFTYRYVTTLALAVVGGVGALDGAAYDEGLVVAELDAHAVLLNAGKLTVELVGALRLLQVELGADQRQVTGTVAMGDGVATLLLYVSVPVVDQTEKPAKVGLSRGVVSGRSEERHCELCVVVFLLWFCDENVFEVV